MLSQLVSTVGITARIIHVNTQLYMKETMYIVIQVGLVIQWDLFIKDTLEPANLSTVERLSTLQMWKMYQHHRKVYSWCLRKCPLYVGR